MSLSRMPTNTPSSVRVGRCICDLIPLKSRTFKQGQRCINNSPKVRFIDINVRPNLGRTFLLPTSYRSKTLFPTGVNWHSCNRLIHSMLDGLPVDPRLKTNCHYYNKEINRYFTTNSVKNRKYDKGSKKRTVRLLDATTGSVGIDKYVDFGDVDQSEWKGYYLKSIATRNTESTENPGKMSTEDPLTETNVTQNQVNTNTDQNDMSPGLAHGEGVFDVAGSQNDVGAGVHVNMAWEALVDYSKLSQEEHHIHLLHRDAVKNGEEFYLDPTTNLYVTTRFSHLKRGDCCGNACRHCPFGLVNVPAEERKKRFFNSAFYI